MDKVKKIIQAPYGMLFLVAIVMSFAIAGVYTLTKDTIEAAALAAQAAARAAVMEDAACMTELPLDEDAPVDYCYEAYDAQDNVIGYVSKITVVGFGGEIEVTVGMDMTGTITAISVGGSDFSETSGLGAKTREPAFTDQFRGMSGMLVLKQNIDSVTGASVSSGAVVSGVNKAVDYMKGLLPEGAVAVDTEPIELTAEELSVLLPGAESAEWMGAAAGITGWWQADGGYIVRATGFGEGPIVVTMGFDDDGVATGVIIGDETFMETEGRGDRILEAWYGAQFIGLTGAQAYGDGVDAISGATVTSDAALSAINACMTFDPADPGAGVVVEDTLPAETTVDAETEASITEEASSEEPVDAVTEASIVEEEEPTEEPIDAVSDGRRRNRGFRRRGGGTRRGQAHGGAGRRRDRGLHCRGGGTRRGQAHRGTGRRRDRGFRRRGGGTRRGQAHRGAGRRRDRGFRRRGGIRRGGSAGRRKPRRQGRRRFRHAEEGYPSAAAASAVRGRDRGGVKEDAMGAKMGMTELLVILVIALVVLGPDKLPQVGRSLGKAVRSVKKYIHEATKELEEIEGMADIKKDVEGIQKDLRSMGQSIEKSVADDVEALDKDMKATEQTLREAVEKQPADAEEGPAAEPPAEPEPVEPTEESNQQEVQTQ